MSVIAQPAPNTRVAGPLPVSGISATLRRLVLGRDQADAWVRPALISVAALAAVLYFVNLTVSGYANTYYSLAAQAASKSWSAWFFGSLDASNFITVDKPPLATMVMGLSVRLLGLNSFAILVPQALMGVASVLVLFRVVRKSFGPVAGLIASLVLALTPVAVLMFRYNNPDALLTLLFLLASWALLRALEAGRLRWLVLSSALVGLAFLTKYLQGWLVLPAFALVWAVAAPGGWRQRVLGLAVSLATVLLMSFAWVAVVELIPVASRPYIGGSTNNSVLDLVFGYDGLGRIFGQGGPAGGGGGAGGGAPGSGPGGGGGGSPFGGASGLLRLFNSQFGGEIAWLLPFALVALVSGLVLRARAPRMDAARTGYLLWGSWLVVTALVFSFMSGIIHPYYSVVLAPAIGALVGAGVVGLWRLRARSIVGGIVLGACFLGSGLVAMSLLDRTPDFAPGLGIGVIAVSAAAALLVAVPSSITGRRTAVAGVALGVVALLAGPAAYAAATMSNGHSSGDPASGPMTSGLGGGGGVPQGGPGGFAGSPAVGVGAPSSGSALVGYLAANLGSARWAVAVSGSSSAADIQLSSDLPVMSMGGFNGGDPAPTLAQLKAYVASGELRFVLVGQSGGPGGFGDGFGGPGGRGGFSGNGGGPDGGPGGGSSGVSSWVTSACTAVDSAVAGTSGLYDCSMLPAVEASLRRPNAGPWQGRLRSLTGDPPAWGAGTRGAVGMSQTCVLPLLRARGAPCDGKQAENRWESVAHELG